MNRQEELRESLTAALAELARAEAPTVTPGCPTDAADAAMKSRERTEIDRVLADRRRKRSELEAALARLDDGEYGLCADCEEPLPAARLRAVPTASRCVACQGAQEGRGGGH